MEEIPARLSAKPTWLITQLSVHAHRLATEAFAEAGAHGYHYRILTALDEFGVASQADLGRRCNMDRSDVVAAINEMAAQGYVERTPDPADRRRNLVSLTETGQQQQQRLEQSLQRAQDELLAPLTAAERKTLTHLLHEVLTHQRSQR
ncbi:DNA-binding MarR family transcriptional regulator [Actinoplanes lutulentus]|uniref:DNA-binding MarR family transcriptional regulator n=1 Tax=Actinoplanes lutulentus TaxID=1287878 RepID=A0A327Z883_9ACTN|nr:MarR family transcriptional regulator [Actinoplanes lutulentus]MBB2948408.1 DNA-binding MarR family transcriptional regulator [Actinoplanes lutulentus]RAK34559.1 DNA-binding MarR family transcriptional regulator [Actinoplanes lutulentus]